MPGQRELHSRDTCIRTQAFASMTGPCAGGEAQADTAAAIAAEYGLSEAAVTTEVASVTAALSGDTSAISAVRILRLLLEFMTSDIQVPAVVAVQLG